MDEHFTSSQRIKRRSEYQRVYDQGARAHGRFMTLFILPNSLPTARLGIAATRKLGGAVERNRAKRLVREIFRRRRPGSSVDVVVIPRPELLHAPLSSLEADFLATARRSPRPRRPAQ